MGDQLAGLAGIERPLLALLLASAVVMGSPGPSTISATAVGAAFGFRRALRYVSGLMAGTALVLLAVAAGLVALLLAMPQAARVLGGVATLYILWLAFQIATAPPLAGRSKTAAAPAFTGGFVLAVANPKAYVAIAAVFADSTLVAADPMFDAVAKLVALIPMIVAIHLVWLLAGTSLAGVLRDPVSSRIVNLALAASLVAVTGATLLRALL